jgi:peptidoglycan/LPS O-acetylase OafA/YrhL
VRESRKCWRAWRGRGEAILHRRCRRSMSFRIVSTLRSDERFADSISSRLTLMTELRTRLPAIDQLTGIRFFFAALVIAFHGAGYLETYITEGGVLHNVLYTGYIGVQFFFVLSGFILTYTYHGARTENFRRDFWTARFARIYPVYLLGILLILPFVLSGAATTGRRDNPSLIVNSLLQIGLLQAWFPEAGQMGNRPGWSLSAEAFFYLLFPLFLPLLSKLKTHHLIVVTATALLIAQLITWCAGIAGLEDIATVPANDPKGTYWLLLLSTNPILRLPEFLIGIAAALLFLRHPKFARTYSTYLVCGSIALIFTTCALLSPYVPMIHLVNGGLGPFIAALFIGLTARKRLIAGLLGRPFLVRLGEASYAMYILHIPVAFLFAYCMRWNALAIHSPISYFALYLTVVVLMSLATFKYIEQPSRRFINRTFKPLSASSVEEVPDGAPHCR